MTDTTKRVDELPAYWRAQSTRTKRIKSLRMTAALAMGMCADDLEEAFRALPQQVADLETKLAKQTAIVDRLAARLATGDTYIKKLDGIIEEVGGVTVSCINPYEDLKRAMLALKSNLAERDAELTRIERENREGWKQATHWRQKAEAAERARAEARELLIDSVDWLKPTQDSPPALGMLHGRIAAFLAANGEK